MTTIVIPPPTPTYTNPNLIHITTRDHPVNIRCEWDLFLASGQTVTAIASELIADSGTGKSVTLTSNPVLVDGQTTTQLLWGSDVTAGGEYLLIWKASLSTSEVLAEGTLVIVDW